VTHAFDRSALLRRAPLPLLLALTLGCGAALAQTSDAPQSDNNQGTQVATTQAGTNGNTPKTLQAVQVQGTATNTYGGGDISRQGNLGVLGNQDLVNVPFSMVSYTSDYIANQQAYTIADVVANDPAVRVGDGYGNFAETFVLRGFPLDGDDITLDGLYGIIPRQLVDAGDIGRLDVLHGASAFLFGVSPAGSGIGGTINVEPKWALDTPLTRATLDYGNDTQVGAQVDFSRRFGAGDRYGIRINLGGRGGDTAVDREGRHSNYQSIAFDYRGDAFRIKADVSHQLQDIDEGRNVVYLTGDGIPKPPPASANYAQPWSYAHLEDTYGLVRAEYDLSSWLTAYAAAGADHSNEYGQYWAPSVDAAGVGTAYRLGVPYHNTSQSGETGLNAHFDAGPVSNKVNLGFSILNQKKTVSYSLSDSLPTDLYNYVAVPYPQTVYDGGSPVVTARTKLHSLALSDTLGFIDDQVLLTVGVRKQTLQELGYAYGTGIQTSNYRQDATSPVVGLVVKLDPNWSLFANSIQGLSEGPQAPIGAINVGQVFPPYKSKQVETGVKYDQGSFGSTFSLFQIKQPSGILNDKTLVYSIAGEQRNRGAEWNVYGEPLSGLKLIGGASYIDAKMTQTADALDNGNVAVGVPKWQYNAGLEWTVPGANGLGLNLGLTRTGAQYADVANTLRIPAWTRVDAGASYATEIDGRAVTFRAMMLNIANNNYWASALGGYLTEGAPRTFKLSASVDF
jgi:iron complex outermembrane recepter protein